MRGRHRIRRNRLQGLRDGLVVGRRPQPQRHEQGEPVAVPQRASRGVCDVLAEVRGIERGAVIARDTMTPSVVDAAQRAG